NSCPPGGLVLDPFLGSGSTLIAAQQVGRRCYGMELDPKYAQVIIQRWQDFTGEKAVREDGTKFDDLF
ncbi:MAG: site-specific DNA-methyltransferase, partial [Bdellovibrionales bacterium]|nr:site-specific DNA-methyltransferase [Bdellovibrionales bacterium]